MVNLFHIIGSYYQRPAVYSGASAGVSVYGFTKPPTNSERDSQSKLPLKPDYLKNLPRKAAKLPLGNMAKKYLQRILDAFVADIQRVNVTHVAFFFSLSLHV